MPCTISQVSTRGIEGCLKKITKEVVGAWTVRVVLRQFGLLQLP